MNKIFYTDCKVAILVYDITRKDSFSNIKKMWIYELKEKVNISNIIICVCSNKIDLYEYQEVNENEVKEFCSENNFDYYETTAKNGTGIDVRNLY